MTKNTTSDQRGMCGRWLLAPVMALAGLALASCTMGADPDPREALVAQPRGKATTWTSDTPMVVVASVDVDHPSPAPISETLVRQRQPEQRELLISIGQNVAHAIDTPIEQAFLAARLDLRGTFAGHTDRDVVESLMVAQADFGVIGGQLSTREQNAGLRQTQIGVELFALAVAPDSPLRSLSPSQVRQIFTGQVQDWKQLGFEGGPIVPVVPADRSMAERAARVMIPGDDFVATVVCVATDRHVADQTLQHKGAIGIVRITDRVMEAGLKLLHIDWVPPTAETFAYGTYPFGLPAQLVTSGPPAGEALRFLAFARSDDGREMLGKKLCTR